MRGRLVAVAAPLLAVAAACATPTENFRDQTEEYLEQSSDVSNQFQGAEVTNAACERPADTNVGTTYRCTAEIAGEGIVSFTIQITDEDEFSIVGYSG